MSLLRVSLAAALLFAACMPDAASQTLAPGAVSVGAPAGRRASTAGLPTVGGPVDAESNPPNILVIVADDLGVDMVEAYGVGGDHPNLPTIAGLIDEGVTFRNVWAAPTCSPSRAALQTGRYGFRTGIGSIVDLVLTIGQTVDGLPLDEVTLPELLDAGTGGRYTHAAIGKWHLGTVGLGGPLAPNEAGYDHFAGILSNFGPQADYYSWPRVEDGVVATSTTYATTQNIDDALAFISSAPQPWFCYLALSAPHGPYQAPPPELHDTDLSSGTDRVLYEAMVQALDSELGRLLDSIAPAVSDRTTVMFLADNGTPGPVVAPSVDATKAKGTLFEGGVRVPLVVTGPTVGVPGSWSESLVHVADVFATVAELAGIDVEATFPSLTLDSYSFAPQLVDPAAPGGRSVLLSEQFNPNGSPPPAWPLPCNVPSGTFCQPDIGFSGPGTVSLSICGPALYGGAVAELLVTGAPPDAGGLLFVGAESNPIPFQGGTLVPFPNFIVTAFQTDAFGDSIGAILGGVGDGGLYHQAFVADASQPKGWAVSNAVLAEFFPADRRAIRDERFKYVVNTVSCEEWLYDLVADPTESNDLLVGTLTPEQQGAYADLSLTLQQTVSVAP